MGKRSKSACIDTEQIDAAVGSIVAIELEIELLKQRLSQTRSKLPALLHELFQTVPPNQIADVVTDLYWRNKTLGGPVKTAYHMTCRGHLPVKPGVVNEPCGDCGKMTQREFTSWTDYHATVDKFVARCDECKERRGEEWEKERAARDAEHTRLRTMPYRAYLKTDHWQTVRKRALQSARYRCQLCNAAKPLHVHHRTYANRGNERPEDVIALCAECHERHHEVIPDIDE